MILAVIVVIIGMVLMDQFTKSAYHMNAFQYLLGAHQLTDEDRLFLREHGPIIYASDNNSPPLRFYDKETGQYKGIVIDYLRALSIELETEIQFKPMVWQYALNSVKYGESDICDMYPSKERSEVYLFSDPVYYQRGVILVRKGNTSINSASDLKGKTIAVQNGDYAYEFLSGSVTGIDYDFSSDYEENIRKLIRGEVEATVGDEPVISYFMNLYDMSDDFEIVDTPLYELPSVLSLPLNEKRLQSIINKGIYALNQKKIIDKIQQKWFGISTPIGNNNDVRQFTIAVIAVAMIASIIVILILIWNLELKKAVDEQTMALKMSKDNLQTLLDGLNQLIVVVSSDLKVCSGNALFYDLFGVNRERIERLESIIPGITEDMRANWLNRHEGSEHIIKGRTYWITSYPIQYEDQPEVTTMLLLEDVTDRKVNESRLLRDNKMAAIGQLATGVAHEIRNPLGLIRNYAFLLKRNKTDEKLLGQSLAVIEESVDKASTIIDNLLNFSRLSDDSIREVPLKTLIENIVNLNDKLMSKSHVKCILHLEEVSIRTQEESLKHILINLINNAIDAMPRNGQLTIWLKKEANGASIHVIDTGMGMTEQTIAKLFDPFFTTKEVGEGTGLGLYIVYNELSKIGGKIDVLSKVGKGTIFKIQLMKEGEA